MRVQNITTNNYKQKTNFRAKIIAETTNFFNKGKIYKKLFEGSRITDYLNKLRDLKLLTAEEINKFLSILRGEWHLRKDIALLKAEKEPLDAAIKQKKIEKIKQLLNNYIDNAECFTPQEEKNIYDSSMMYMNRYIKN